MVAKYGREEIIKGLQEQLKQQHALLMFGAGTGLTAKCADIGGADLIAVYSTAKFRMIGQPTLLAWMPYEDCNACVKEMAREIIPVIKRAPCIAGIGAHNPAVNLSRIIDEMMELGFSGITNEPFAGLYGDFFAQQLEAAGIGFSREVELIQTAHAKDIFTVAWAFNAQEARIMAQAGADVIGAIVGVTSGGLTGAQELMTMEQAVETVQQIMEAAQAVNSKILILTHGGPFKDVQTAAYSVQYSAAHGYASGSSGERMPTENAVIEITRQYKGIKLK
ncbi:MAG: phosphoenolpyruvate hydrolase family protein [Syntrophomonadaceae bacterium]|jgi:predicted TIM-barrel enzyme|nr:phosphoenolpyruvate hydrolase family protein [Syntrophomonadaceae bacterium]